MSVVTHTLGTGEELKLNANSGDNPKYSRKDLTAMTSMNSAIRDLD